MIFYRAKIVIFIRVISYCRCIRYFNKTCSCIQYGFTIQGTFLLQNLFPFSNKTHSFFYAVLLCFLISPLKIGMVVLIRTILSYFLGKEVEELEHKLKIPGTKHN